MPELTKSIPNWSGIAVPPRDERPFRPGGGPIGDEPDRLEPALLSGGFQPGAEHLRGDILRGDIIFVRPRLAPAQGIGGEELDMRLERRLFGRELLRLGERRQHEQRQKEQATQHRNSSGLPPPPGEAGRRYFAPGPPYSVPKKSPLFHKGR